MSWTGDASQLHRDNPAMQYVLGKEGGEIWSDFFAIPKSSEHQDAAYAFINYLLDPQHNKLEVLSHGYPSGDKRVDALLPTAMLDDPIMYPAAEALSPLEFGAAATLTSPLRAELMARFKSA
jgi:spermidine/putrescine transport system substrate-binding protein